MNEEQLDRIESKVDRVVTRVETLERRASFWGALSAVLIIIVQHFFTVLP